MLKLNLILCLPILGVATLSRFLLRLWIFPLSANWQLSLFVLTGTQLELVTHVLCHTQCLLPVMILGIAGAFVRAARELIAQRCWLCLREVRTIAMRIAWMQPFGVRMIRRLPHVLLAHYRPWRIVRVPERRTNLRCELLFECRPCRGP